jgi:hypothetical protein
VLLFAWRNGIGGRFSMLVHRSRWLSLPGTKALLVPLIGALLLLILLVLVQDIVLSLSGEEPSTSSAEIRMLSLLEAHQWSSVRNSTLLGRNRHGQYRRSVSINPVLRLILVRWTSNITFWVRKLSHKFTHLLLSIIKLDMIFFIRTLFSVIIIIVLRLLLFWVIVC